MGGAQSQPEPSEAPDAIGAIKKLLREEYKRLHIVLERGEGFPTHSNDPYVTVRCDEGTSDTIERRWFHGDDAPWIAKFSMKANVVNPVWFEEQVVLCKKDSREFTLECMDDDYVSDDLLLDMKVTVPDPESGWVSHKIQLKNGAFLILKVRCYDMEDKFVKETEHEAFEAGMRTHPIELDDGTKAILRYRRCPENNKALFWIPGCCGSFMHPHLMTSALQGYDLYSISYRNVSQCRKHCMKEEELHLTSYPGESSSFDRLLDEIQVAIDFMNAQKAYNVKLAYGGSTGGLILANFLMENGDDQFDGFILNGPFFSWGHVGGFVNEVFVSNVPTILEKLTNIDPSSPILFPEKPFYDPLNFKLWSVYSFDLATRPLKYARVTQSFCAAVNKTFAKFRGRRNPVTFKPTIVFSCDTDTVLESDETVEMTEEVFSPQLTKIILKQGQHDVFLGFDQHQVQISTTYLAAWLQNFPN